MDELRVGNKGSHLEINTDGKIREQLDFVEWLKNQGMYSPVESAATMQKMFRVFIAVNKPQFPDPCTVEQYEQITKEKFPDDGAVWVKWKQGWKVYPYSLYLEFQRVYGIQVAIVQTGKPCPDANWKPEVKS